VEGDNLDVRPRLAPAYGPFDVVYLDPPYNTGNPFAYNDKTAGRRADRHRAWEAMMRPRLEAVGTQLNEQSTAQFDAFMKAEVTKYAKLIKDANIKIE